jgi:hypothetical protein
VSEVISTSDTDRPTSKSMSEVAWTSDKEGPKQQGDVRSRVNFGHGPAKKARACPKSRGLRTRKSQNSKEMSEVV